MKSMISSDDIDIFSIRLLNFTFIILVNVVFVHYLHDSAAAIAPKAEYL